MREEINSLLKKFKLPMAKRLQLGRKLSLLPSKLQEIEYEALVNENNPAHETDSRQEKVLWKMIRYWLDENPKATYSKFLGILSEDEEHRSIVDKQYTPEELLGTLVPSLKGKL